MPSATTSGRQTASSTKAAPDMPSAPTMKLRIALQAALLERGASLDIAAYSTNATNCPNFFNPGTPPQSPEKLIEFLPNSTVLATIWLYFAVPVVFPSNFTSAFG